MTTVTIQSDPDKKTLLLVQLAEELGLTVESKHVAELDTAATAIGIGRKATDEELITYFEKRKNDDPIDIALAFSKYSDSK